ncbi:MAG: hypothetical protein GTO41_09645, partial [Burkholderiales bacterium]|nr:hypothetical protein [Burkholderiales bacterium]
LLWSHVDYVSWWIVPVVGAAAIIAVAADVLLPRKRIDMISSVYFGIVVGLFMTYVVGLALSPLLDREVTGP